MNYSLQLPVFKAPPALTHQEINKQTKSSLEREESDIPNFLRSTQQQKMRLTLDPNYQQIKNQYKNADEMTGMP